MDPAAMIAQSTAPASPRSMQPEATKEDESYVEFKVPPDFQPPDNAKPGEDFQALGTFRIDEDDPETMCLVAVDGSKVTPEDEGDETPPTSPLPPAPPVA